VNQEGEVTGNDKVKENCEKICKEVIWYVEVRFLNASVNISTGRKFNCSGYTNKIVC
jgi:hypothetical protein